MTFRLLVLILLLTTAPVPSLAGDAARGEDIYLSLCGGCHSLDAHRVGPMHRGVYGRTAGSVKGFGFSAALQASGVVWGEATLDAWLINPEILIPGQRMFFRVADATDRADVIAYLRRESAR